MMSRSSERGRPSRPREADVSARPFKLAPSWLSQPQPTDDKLSISYLIFHSIARVWKFILQINVGVPKIMHRAFGNCRGSSAIKNTYTRILILVGCIILLVFLANLLRSSPDLDAMGTGLQPATSTPSGKACRFPGENAPLPAFLIRPINESHTNKTLVMYNYYESQKAMRNLKFFLDHGVHSRSDTDFLLVSNSHICLDLPYDPNFGLVFRNNTCFDLGSHGEMVSRFDLLHRYSKFILLNGSVRGPFMPSWSQDCWTDSFTRHLNENIKLVGPTFNCIGANDDYKPHLQSMILAFDRPGLAAILPSYRCFTSKRQAINEAETTNFANIRKEGYKAQVFMDQFQSDIQDLKHCSHGVPRDVHPYELIFIKTTPNILPELVSELTDFTDKSNYDSRDFCTG